MTQPWPRSVLDYLDEVARVAHVSRTRVAQRAVRAALADPPPAPASYPTRGAESSYTVPLPGPLKPITKRITVSHFYGRLPWLVLWGVTRPGFADLLTLSDSALASFDARLYAQPPGALSCPSMKRLPAPISTPATSPM